MIEATTAPDGFTWARTALALAFFLFVPGRKLLSGGPFFKDAVYPLVFPFRTGLSFSDYIEAVVASVLLLAGVSMALAFTVGLSLISLLAAYACLGLSGLLWWTFKKS